MNYFQLLSKLYHIYDRLAGQTVDQTVILKKIRAVVTYPDCKIISNRSLSIASNELEVAGVYDSELDEEGHSKPIEIEIQFPKKKPTFTFDESDMSRNHWSELCVDFANILGHEYVHLHQFRRRDFKWPKPYKSYNPHPRLKEQEEYYGDNDEVDAYAYIAAAEMAIDSFNPIEIQPTDIERTRVYKTYTRVFDKKSPVVLKLEKRAQRYYKLLERQYNETYPNKSNTK